MINIINLILIIDIQRIFFNAVDQSINTDNSENVEASDISVNIRPITNSLVNKN